MMMAGDIRRSSHGQCLWSTFNLKSCYIVFAYVLILSAVFFSEGSSQQVVNSAASNSTSVPHETKGFHDELVDSACHINIYLFKIGKTVPFSSSGTSSVKQASGSAGSIKQAPMPAGADMRHREGELDAVMTAVTISNPEGTSLPILREHLEAELSVTQFDMMLVKMQENKEQLRMVPLDDEEDTLVDICKNISPTLILIQTGPEMENGLENKFDSEAAQAAQTYQALQVPGLR